MIPRFMASSKVLGEEKVAVAVAETESKAKANEAEARAGTERQTGGANGSGTEN